MLEGLDGKVKQEISAFTFKRVTGGMKVINKYKDKWSHTKGIQFPEPSSKKYIDILLRIDYPQFHTSIKENKWKNGDPDARLTLGWTCAGQSVTPTTQLINFIKTYQMKEIEDLDYALCRFSEIESQGTNTQSAMTADEKKTVKLVQDLLMYKDGRYEVGIPWKRDLSVYLTTMILQSKE